MLAFDDVTTHDANKSVISAIERLRLTHAARFFQEALLTPKNHAATCHFRTGIYNVVERSIFFQH